MVRETLFPSGARRAIAALALCLTGAAASAQAATPPPAIDLGSPNTAMLVHVQGNHNSPSVTWFKFTIPEVSPTSGHFLDINTEGTQLGPNDTEIALYDANGNLVGYNDQGGTGALSAFSFGATTPVRVGFDGGMTNGQDGSLAAGTYYLAFTGYNGFNVFGPTGFGVVSQSQSNGFYQIQMQLGPIAPVADAGPSQNVPEGSVVTLDGSDSIGIAGGVCQFAWSQTTGPIVSLNTADPAHPTFTAPPVASGQVGLGFTLTATSQGISSSAATTVMVNHVDVGPQPVACCDIDGNCTFVVATACLSPSSAQANGSTCTANPCPQPGPCCSAQLRALHAFNVYSANDIVLNQGTAITGATAAGSGYSLPPAPSVTTTNINIRNGGAYAPGNYGSMNAANNSTFNFSAGTYVFTSWTVNDGTTFNLDTSGGCIRIIVTSGASFHDRDTLSNTGASPVQFLVSGGSLSVHDKLTATGVDLLVLSGTATFHDFTNGSLNVYASGQVSFHTGGTISPNTKIACP